MIESDSEELSIYCDGREEEEVEVNQWQLLIVSVFFISRNKASIIFHLHQREYYRLVNQMRNCYCKCILGGFFFFFFGGGEFGLYKRSLKSNVIYSNLL